jgi:hypothetical protein
MDDQTEKPKTSKEIEIENLKSLLKGVEDALKSLLDHHEAEGRLAGNIKVQKRKIISLNRQIAELTGSSKK